MFENPFPPRLLLNVLLLRQVTGLKLFPVELFVELLNEFKWADEIWLPEEFKLLDLYNEGLNVPLSDGASVKLFKPPWSLFVLIFWVCLKKFFSLGALFSFCFSDKLRVSFEIS